MSTPLPDIFSNFLARDDLPSAPSAKPVTKAQVSTVAKATSTLLATARAIVAASPTAVVKEAAPTPAAPAVPQTGPRYIARAPATPRAEPGSAAAVFQGAVRQVPEPDGPWDPAAAFDAARAARDDGRYGTPINGGNHS